MVPELLAITSLLIAFVMILYVFWERLNKSQRKSLLLMATAILLMISYTMIAPKYYIEPTGEYIVYVTNTTVTMPSNGVTVTKEINITVTSPVYRPNVAVYAYAYLVVVIAFLLILIGFYFIISDMLRPRRLVLG